MIHLNQHPEDRVIRWKKAGGVWYCQCKFIWPNVGIGPTRRAAKSNLQRQLNIEKHGSNTDLDSRDKFGLTKRAIKAKTREVRRSISAFKRRALSLRG